MSQTAKFFALGDILSITTAKWLSTDKGVGVGGLLAWLFGQEIPMCLLPEVLPSARTELLEQLPDLLKITPSYESGRWQAWLTEQEQQYGRELSVVPLPEEKQAEIKTVIDSLDEGTKKIVFGKDGISVATKDYSSSD